jgi:hypothetical protein
VVPASTALACAAAALACAGTAPPFHLALLFQMHRPAQWRNTLVGAILQVAPHARSVCPNIGTPVLLQGDMPASH